MGSQSSYASLEEGKLLRGQDPLQKGHLIKRVDAGKITSREVGAKAMVAHGSPCQWRTQEDTVSGKMV